MRTVTGPRILGLALMAVAALALAGCGNGPKRRITTTVTTTAPARVAAPVAGGASGAAAVTGTGVAGSGATGADAGGADSGGADSGGADSGGAEAGGVADAVVAAKRGAGAAAPPPGNPAMHGTGNKMIAGTIGFGVLANGVVQSTVAGASAAAGAAGLAGAGGQQCQNPFGTQAASAGELICSSEEERLQCQCDANGCQLVPTGIMACLPVGAVYR